MSERWKQTNKLTNSSRQASCASGYGANLSPIFCSVRRQKFMSNNGSFKKKCQQNCSSVFCWSLLLFYSDKVHKQWLKVWFLTSQMPVLSGGMNFVPFEITSKIFFSKIPMKCSKNGQKFAMSKNTSNMLFETCWTPCKKPHFSTWSRSRYTFFWMTRYQLHNISTIF